ncbi:MAG: hypothetical protein FJZ92_04830 [Chloroflexi bacterium]|nr:hypothetical protein [Chloroflexota bacterium]
MTTTTAAPRLHELADEGSAIDFCYEQGWTDGLPVVPPTEARVEATLAWAGRPPEEVVATHPPTGRACTVHAAAVNAVMAGCLPEYFPVVVAALEALNDPDYAFHGSSASTGGSAPLLIVSGPIADEIGMNSGVNVFGSGNRANATIGRAIRLILLNVFRMTPAIADRSTTGWPGKYSACIAEDESRSPWEPLRVALGIPEEVSAVTVFAASGFHNIENHYTNDPEALLSTFADSMRSLGALSAGQSVIVMSPEHAQIAASRGFTRPDVQEYLYAHAWRPRGDLRRAGKIPADAPGADDEPVHRGLSPNDILLLVAGGEAGGHSAFISSWSRGRGSLFQTKPIGVCLDC